MDSEKLIRTCIEVCEDRKARDVAAYDVRGASTLADFYLFCSGTSSPHLRAIQQHLDQALKQEGTLPRAVEGTPDSHWILLDYDDVLVHVFLEETRDFYRIEELLEGEQFYPETVAAAGE